MRNLGGSGVWIGCIIIGVTELLIASSNEGWKRILLLVGAGALIFGGVYTAIKSRPR